MTDEHRELAQRLRAWADEVYAAMDSGGYAAGDHSVPDVDDVAAAADVIEAQVVQIERLSAALAELLPWADLWDEQSSEAANRRRRDQVVAARSLLAAASSDDQGTRG